MSAAADLESLINIKLNRRHLLGGAGALLAASTSPVAVMAAATPVERPFTFEEISHGVDETHHVAKGHDVQVVIRWGDPILPGAPAFDPQRQSPEAQAQQFGYNNDYVGYIPLGRDRAIMCVNHEYAISHLMFPGKDHITPTHCAIEQAAVGASIIEIERRGGQWHVVQNSPRNRRITASGTVFDISGPARGSARLATSADPKAEQIIGTFGNCAGGVTPWGTYLSSEENVDENFIGTLAPDHRETRNHQMMGVPGGLYQWGRFDPRFDIGKEPNEPNRFGWVIEVDALDPSNPPKKRTAMGRFKHEGAETVISSDGRLVIYMGDDERFQHLYRFVSRDRVDHKNRAANRDLLDHGILSVARFDPQGVTWLPLVFGQGPLTPENGFESQADVVIEARHAAKLLGATPMDRPEDVQPHPTNGKVYVMLTNNNKRQAGQEGAANPRADNVNGHIVELAAPGGDHGAARFDWDVLVLCGPLGSDATWNPATSANGWFASPDNCTIDPHGRLWVATDQGAKWPGTGSADGIWALGTSGPDRGRGYMFFRVPVGAEMCGPCFAPDGRTLFAAVQHPGADGVANYAPFGRASTFDDPATRWPDFDPKLPPRPSLIAITRKDNKEIGL
ncbi:PhoX family protein [Aquisediminimonas sediminicola]|uniref:PhoX family protein n=1 Tax=Alteraquisediminimonas sediminicola TaxID=2676787 RepID=UPI001C8CF721|nr:PhoX family phosphatase [Aquisediminimonas sediminicola]